MPSTSTTGKRPGAYAVSTETKGEPVFFATIVPANTTPGASFTFRAGERRGLTARCPPNARPGDTLQVAISPEPETHETPLKMASLTAPLDVDQPNVGLEGSAGGGRELMKADIRKANQQFLEETADTFLVTIPSSVSQGQKFIAQTPSGERLLVTCPPGAKGGDNLRIPAPQHEEEDSPTQAFQIQAPMDAYPRQVLPVKVCGKKIMITLPDSVVPGQTLQLRLPKEQVAGSIELSYEHQSTSPGWTRTLRLPHLKFQWIFDHKSVPQSMQIQKQKYALDQAAFCRKLCFLEGNDPRMRTGTCTLVPAPEVWSDSTFRHHHRTLVSYATVADVQTKPLEEKLLWFQGVCSELTAPWESGRVKLVVRRSHLLADSLQGIMSLSRADMRKRWRVEFMGEPAIDSGGVMREFMQLVSNQLFNPDFGLWLPSVNNQKCMRINPASHISCPEDHLLYFRFLGRLMGRALFDRQLIDGHMVRYLYKHILGWPITFEDLRASDDEFYQSLSHFTKMTDEEVSSLCLDFTLSEDTLGVHQNLNLIENGKDIEVTGQNLPQYLEAILKYRMLDRAKLQITELLLGFYDIIPEPTLTVFDPNELELVLCGLPTIDMDDWQSNSIYSGGCVETDDVVKWFWEIVRDEFDQEMRARLLQFVTGTSGVPSRGFSVLQGNDGNIKKFAIHGVDCRDYSYPRAHTCFNRIDLPNFSTKEELLEKLKTAVTMSSVGFSIE